VRALARGGMGKVYFGEQTALGRPCAVKVLDPRLASAEGGDFTRRFLLEASVASKIAHPNVVTVFDYGETADGRCFIAMEYLDGRTLAEELKKGRLPAGRAMHVARQLCRALREAHALGVVHRDVKPGNVFLMKRDEDEDFVKVLDFGLVGEAHAQDAPESPGADVPIMGSPRYMAPEQVQGTAADARADVYATGAVLYAMLAGRPPFERASDMATMMAQVSDVPPPLTTQVPGLPAGLEDVVLKCLAKDPDERFATMDDLLSALKLSPDGSLGAPDSGRSGPMPGLPIPSTGTPSAQRSAAPYSSRPPRRAVLTPVTIVAICAAVVFGVIGASELRRRLAVSDAPPPAAAALAAPLVSSAGATAAAVVPGLRATLHLETVPAGAKVKEEGETLCEATPCDIVYAGEAASPKTEHLLVFMKADYKLERKIATADLASLSVKLTHSK
jgi:serine/threonine protein kinase